MASVVEKAIAEALTEHSEAQRRIDKFEDEIVQRFSSLALVEKARIGVVTESDRLRAHVMGTEIAADIMAEHKRRLLKAGGVKSIDSTIYADSLTPGFLSSIMAGLEKSVAGVRRQRSVEAEERAGIIREMGPRDGGYVSFPAQEVFTGNAESKAQPVASAPPMAVTYETHRNKDVDFDGNDITPRFHKREYPAPKRGKRG